MGQLLFAPLASEKKFHNISEKAQLTLVTSGNKIAQKEEKLFKRQKYEIRDSGDGELVLRLTPSNHDLTPTAMTDRGTGSRKRDHGAMVAQPTASNG